MLDFVPVKTGYLTLKYTVGVTCTPTTRFNYIRVKRYGHPLMPSDTHPDHQLNVTGHLIAAIQLSIIAFLFDGQQLKNLALIHANTPGNFRQTLIGLVACLINNINIEKLFLVLEQVGTKLPESLWGYL